MSYVLATSREWNVPMKERLEERTACSFTLITQKDELTLERLRHLQPDYVFFPHWSYIIPEIIFNHFQCIIFHMTDVPFGRGGSPLQNLIARGIYQTKISALRCVKEVDAGPVYMKKDLCLHGSAEEIYLRAGEIIEEMIVEIIQTNPSPQEQSGKPVAFQRRKPGQGDISKLESLEQVFDHIRMLDADGYPQAFIEMGDFRLEFSRASLKYDKVIADVRIIRKEDL